MEIRKYFEVDESEITTYEILWEIAKTSAYREVYTVLNVYVSKEERSQSRYLSFHLKKRGGKKEQIKYIVS